MSNKALNWAFDSGLPPGPRFVLVVLGDAGNDHGGEDWGCFPSINRIRDMTGFGARTIERHLEWLEAEGWISRIRRRRPDGRLGLYDYQLHRDVARRSALKAERSGGAGRGEDADEPLEADEPPANLATGEGDDPPANLATGLPANLDATTRQIRQEPPAKLAGQEPLIEPLGEPSLSAREPGDEGFEGIEALWPDEGRARTNWPEARALFALWATELGAERLTGAVRRYLAEDRDLRRGDYGAPGLHAWFAAERFRAWLGEARPAAPPGPALQFDGPPDLLEAIVLERGPEFAGSYLAPARFDPAARTLTPATGYAAGKLGELRELIKRFGVELVDRNASRGSA